MLESMANACVECGAMIGVGAEGSYPPPIQSHVPSQVNTIKFEETRTHRTLEANFTDTAVDNLSGPLAAFFASGMRPSPTKTNNQTSMQPTFVDDGPVALNDGVSSSDTIVDVSPVNTPDNQTANTDKDRLEEIFRIEGEELKLIELDLKASSQKDFVLRLSCLFLYAQEVLGRSRVPRSSLNEVLKAQGVYDPNAASAITNSLDIVKDGDDLSLSRSGRGTAKNILGEVLDGSVAATWQLGSRPRKRSQSASPAEEVSAQTGTRKAKQSQGSSPTVQDWTKKWKDQYGEVRAHQILKLRSVEDCGTFALWAIAKVTNGSVLEVTRRKLAEFIHAAFDLKVSDRTLESQLKKSSKVVHVVGTKFRLNPDGYTFVEDLIQE